MTRALSTLTPAKLKPKTSTRRSSSGDLAAFRRDPLGFITAAASAGSLVPLRFGRTPAYLVVDPELIEQVLVREHRKTVKTPQLRAHSRLLGAGLLTNEGDAWLRQRRLAQPAFHKEAIARYGAIMVDRAEALTDCWKAGQIQDIHEQMQRLTVQIAARTLFGSEVDHDAPGLGSALDAVMRRFVERRGAARLLPGFIPTPGRVGLERAARRLDEVVLRIIAERRQTGSGNADLLSMLLAARDEDGSGLDDRQLRDEVVTIFVGGFDTPALGLAWGCQLLGEHPDAEASLLTELRDRLGDRRAAAEDAARLPFTTALITEALRLYPPAWMLAREVTEPVELGGRHIASGTQLLLSPWVVHRDARWFTEPERFRPERWLDGGTDRIPRFAYFPFGGGPRVCIGAGFAMTEAVLAFATIARRFRLRPTGPRPTPWPALTLRPHGGVPVRVDLR